MFARLTRALDRVGIPYMFTGSFASSFHEWARRAQSERQIEDVAGILRIRAADLDRDYIEQWVEHLQVESQWSQALKVAGEV